MKTEVKGQPHALHAHRIKKKKGETNKAIVPVEQSGLTPQTTAETKSLFPDKKINKRTTSQLKATCASSGTCLHRVRRCLEEPSNQPPFFRAARGGSIDASVAGSRPEMHRGSSG